MARGVTALFARWIEPKHPIPAERQRYTNEGLKRLIAPIIIEQFLAMLVGLADTMMISYAGEAVGDVFYTTAAAIFSTVVCRVALSYLFGVVCGWGVIGIGLAMAGDWCIKAALIWGRFRSGKWKEKRII